MYLRMYIIMVFVGDSQPSSGDYGQIKDGMAKVTSKVRYSSEFYLYRRIFCYFLQISSVAGNMLETIQDRYHGYKN